MSNFIEHVKETLPKKFSQTELYLLGKYGRMIIGTEELKDELGYASTKSVLNAISAEAFPVKTYARGGRRVADIRDVAAYLDRARNG